MTIMGGAGIDRRRLSADRYPPASPSIGMELPKAVRILYKICGEAATTLSLKGAIDVRRSDFRRLSAIRLPLPL